MPGVHFSLTLMLMTVYAHGEELRGNMIAFEDTYVYMAYQYEEQQKQENTDISNMEELCNVCALKSNFTIEFHNLDLKWLAMLGHYDITCLEHDIMPVSP